MPEGTTYMTTERVQTAYVEIARGIPAGESTLQPLSPLELSLWRSIEETYARAEREGLIVEIPKEWPE